MAKEKGKIDVSKLRIPPEKHELDTARFFAEQGHDVVFIPPTNIPGVHTPDIIMMGVEWEIKSPKGKTRNVMLHNIKRALRQSDHIILDLRRMSTSEVASILQIEKIYNERQNIKRILVIKKNGELIDYSTRTKK